MEKSKNIIISVKDFSISPGPRYVEQGDYSGELYYHTVLNYEFKTAFEQGVYLIVNLDGVDGYLSSFLDEAFGNLVYDFGVENVRQHLEIVSIEEPEWITMIENDTYSDWENRRSAQKYPKKTVEHDDWFAFNNGHICIKNIK